MPVHIVSSGGSIDFQVFANYTGIYHVAVPGDSTYTITPLYPGNILPACPASGSATTTVPGDSTQTLNFSYTCTGDSMDLAIAGHTIWFYSTSYSPCSTGPVDMTVTIPNGAAYDSNSAYAAIYQQPDTVIGNQLFWHLQDFANFSTVIGLVADTSIIHPGDIICTTMHITALPGEADTANNTYSFCTPWTGSFDPNDKMALPAGAGPESYIPAATPALTYLINFQNTGTDTATSVILRDTLSTYVDAASLQLIGASHPVALSQQGNTLAFSFPGIQLPDSNASEPESHGYVMYSVRMQDSLPPSTSITNSASIYFDGNTPVVTNTTINTIEFPASTATGLLHPAPAIAIYPNPASGVFSINMPDDFENWHLTVSDIRGTSILTMPTLTQQHLYIRLQAAPGLYFVRLRNERSGAVVIKKMILSP